jgi:prephenate dehydratase
MKAAAIKVAIQGELGSFSHEAAEHMLPRCRVVPCAHSAEVFDRVEGGSVAAAVIPIENSLAGTVAEHADLLVTRDVFIQGEFQLRIVHNLIAAPGVKLAALRKVLSHPVALDQCRDFFRHHLRIVPVPFYDTAGSVKHVVAHRIQDAAGIAGRHAAREYSKGCGRSAKGERSLGARPPAADSPRCQQDFDRVQSEESAGRAVQVT